MTAAVLVVTASLYFCGDRPCRTSILARLLDCSLLHMHQIRVTVSAYVQLLQSQL